jgi:hypothetical protein
MPGYEIRFTATMPAKAARRRFPCRRIEFMRGGLMMRWFNLLGISCLIAGSVQAQTPRSNTQGLMLHANVAGVALSVTEGSTTETESGSGFGAAIGFGFSSRWTVLFDLSASRVNISDGLGNYGLGQAFLAGRFHFNDASAMFRPYLEAGLAGRGIAADVGSVRVEANGSGLGIGGGFQWFLNSKTAFDVGLRYIGGSFDEWSGNGVSVPIGSIDAVTTTVRIGITIFPQMP